MIFVNIQDTEVKSNICTELTDTIFWKETDDRCIKCRINNLTLPILRTKTMRAVSAIQLEKRKISEDRI